MLVRRARVHTSRLYELGGIYDVLRNLENMVKLFRMVNIEFLVTFLCAKDRFPSKYYIFGHYVRKYGFLKKRIFFEIF